MGVDGQYRALVIPRRILPAGLAALLAPAAAQAAECRLALVLAMDVSSSVSAEEDSLQRGGLAAALIAPEVTQAMFAADLPVAMAVFEWSGRYHQELLVDWRVIRDRSDLLSLAEDVARSQRSHNDFPTAMGHALGYAEALLQRAPDCLFKVIDMAGDGANNEGYPPTRAYGAPSFSGVTVNGLVVNMPDYKAEQPLADYYRTEVLFGPGAFLEIAQGFADYERAMRRKLERELKPGAIGAVSDAPGTAPG